MKQQQCVSFKVAPELHHDIWNPLVQWQADGTQTEKCLTWMNSWMAAGKATSQEGMNGSRAKMADARVDAYTKWVSNIRSVSHVNSAWKSANCTSLRFISWEIR